MRKGAGLISFFILLLTTQVLHAQCPSPDFTIPASACQQQNLTLTNLSPAGDFQWDFCSGDLAGTPTGSLAYTLPGVNGRPALEYAKDGNTWYAFATGTFNNLLFRLTFSDGLQQPPLIENLGSLGGILKGPGSIRILKHNGNWFGLIHNTDNNGEVLKLSFGSSLTNAITTTSLIKELGNINSGLAVGFDETHGWVALLSTPSNEFKIIRLGNDLSPPQPADILTTAAVPNPNSLFDVDLVKQCDQWYAFSINLGDGAINRLSFGTSLFQQPTITGLVNLGGQNGGRLRVIEDAAQYYLGAVTLGGSFIKVALGQDLATPTNVVTNEGNLGVLQSPVGVGVVLDQSVWTIGTVDSSNGQVVSVKYPNTCSVQIESADAVSAKIRYAQQGVYQVALKMTNSSGLSRTITKPVTISSNSSPDIAIASQNVCAGNTVNFTSQNTSGGITAYDWDFGDASAHSNASQPDHIFAGSGSYNVVLTVSAANGCLNTAQKTIKQYVAPVADFSLPLVLICTNNQYTFQNNTTDVYEGNLTYQWKVESVAAGTQRDLNHTFTTTGNKNIELIVSIPGCSDNEVKTATNVNTGPAVGFTFAGKCVAEPFAFTNTSSGDIAGYSWTFGDGKTSTTADPSNTYTTAAIYPVTLATFGTNGCVSATTQNVSVYSLPSPAFSLDLPPFSCSGTPSQFHDATPPPADSNIQAWTWAFGDNGTGSEKNPTHTYTTAGSYTVRLTTFTDKGCSAFKDQEVTIAPSPVPSFTNNAACASQATQFTNTSTGDIKTYQWRIGNSSYSLKDPAHVFLSPGTYAIQLSITGQNNCAAVLDKQLVVPVVPSIEIDLKNACSGQPAVFTDVTSGAADAVALRTWTFNNTAQATGNEVNYTFANAGTYPVQLQVQNQSGCVYSITRQFTINPSPNPSFTTSVDSGPAPLAVTFTNTSTNSTSWQWNFNDGSATSTEKSPTHIFQNLGQYAVDLKAIGAGGCNKTVSLPVSVIVPFNELALTELAVVQSDDNAPYKGYVRVANVGNYRISNFTVFYEVGGGVRLKEIVNATLNPGQTGLFLLSNEFTGTGYICAELDDDSNLANNKACATLGKESILLNAYPNPADSYLDLETIHSASDQLQVTIYNSSGAEAYNRTFDTTTGLSHLTLDTQNLSPGIYVVVLSTSTATSVRRILISR